MAGEILTVNAGGFVEYAALSSGQLPASGVTAGTYGDATHSGRVTVDAAGRVTAASNVLITGGGGGGGGEIGYDQITGNVTITSTTEATPTAVIACAAHTFDGAAVMLEFSTQGFFVSSSASGDGAVIVLFEGATEITQLGTIQVGSTGSYQLAFSTTYRFTPSAASHTYTIGAFKLTAGTVPVVVAGAGGAATARPAFARFTKV